MNEPGNQKVLGDLAARNSGGSAADAVNGRRVLKWLFVGTLIAGTVVRVVMYLVATPQYDEAYTHLNFATTSLWDAASLYNTPNNHIFHSILTRLAHIPAGGDILITRLPALIAGILVVPATSYFAWEVTRSRMIALLSGIFAAFHPQLILYSANARGYTLIALLALIWGILGHRIATDESVPARTWIALCAVSALGIWTIPVFIYVVIALTSWVILLRRVRHRLTWRFLRHSVLSGLLAVALTLLAFLPAILRMSLESMLTNPLLNPTDPRLGGVPGRELSAFLDLLPGYLADVTSWMGGSIPIVLSFVFALLVVVGIASPRTPVAVRMLVPLFIPVALLLMAAQRLHPLARSWVTLLPFLLVTAAAGARTVMPHRQLELSPMKIVIATIGLIAGTWTLVHASMDYDSSLRDVAAADMNEVVKLMQERFPDGATLVVSPSTLPQAQYWLAQSPNLVLGSDTRVVAIDHRLDGSLDDLAEMRHLYARDKSEPARRVGISKDTLVPLAGLRSTTLYWNGH